MVRFGSFETMISFAEAWRFFNDFSETEIVRRFCLPPIKTPALMPENVNEVLDERPTPKIRIGAEPRFRSTICWVRF